MLLADMGAEVLRLDRPTPGDAGISKPPRFDLTARGRRSAVIDLKHPQGVACALSLVERADILIEGFRPGTMERLGLGPERCLTRNPRLVYGRITGWGQDGPLASVAGHDLNYIALTGVLDAIGRAGAPPTPPLNLVGDYGGGSLFLAFGVVCALLEARKSGQGQVVDAAMVDGAAALMTAFFGLRAAGMHSAERGSNLLDSGAPFYDTYVCADGRYVAVASIEPKFREILFERLGLDPDEWRTLDQSHWPLMRAVLAKKLSERTRDEWCALLEGTDACFAPVLSIDEAPDHPHNQARGTFIAIDGIVQPAPAPRFSRTVLGMPSPPEAAGASTESALGDWGIPTNRIAELRHAGAIGTTPNASRPEGTAN
jgi:alpha-methylacyl-CoA racemase